MTVDEVSKEIESVEIVKARQRERRVSMRGVIIGLDCSLREISREGVCES